MVLGKSKGGAARLVAAAAVIAAAGGVAVAHEVAVDWRGECTPSGGVATQARHEVGYDAQAGRYVFTATDDRGRVRYSVLPGRADGSNGLFSVECKMDDGEQFTLTQGVSVTARDADRHEIGFDGTLRILAMQAVDVDADGPGGYMKEPAGHGPCIRIGDTLPVEAHTTGFATYAFDLPAGRYEVGVRYRDDADDRGEDSYLRLSVDGEALGQWNPTLNDDAWHEKLFEAELRPGSVLRIEARTEDTGGTGQEFCRISHILVRPAEGREVQVGHRLEGQVLTLSQGEALGEGVPAVEAGISLRGRALRCHLRQAGAATPPAGLTGLEVLPSAGTPEARILNVPYVREPVVVNGDGGLFSTFICRFQSHCTSWRTAGSVNEQTGEASAFGTLSYLPNSAEAFYDLNEILFITASPRLLDVLPSFPTRRASGGRAEIGRRMVFDHWRMAHGEGLENQMRLMDGCGLKGLLAILHTWMHYGYDRKQPQFTPANPARWSEEQFKSAIAACREMGWRVAVHENYNHMDWDSPYNSGRPVREFGEPDRPGDPGPEEAMGLVASAPGEDLSRQPRNAWAFARLADLRVAPGPLSRPEPPAFPISSDKMLFYSQIESHRIRESYGTNAGYLDVTPCVQPGIGTWDLHIDLDARNNQARGFGQAYLNAARQFAHHRDLFEVSTGEGGYYASYHPGYIHAVERQVATKMQTPIIPEHELSVIRPLSFHHGMGYYSRYFTREGEPLPSGAEIEEEEWDGYRAMEIAFGHAGFMGDALFPGHMPGPEAIREYHLLRALQEAYADARLVAVEYADGGQWISAEEGLGRQYDFVQARIRLRYAGGLEIALNFDREEDWTVSVAGKQYVLPPRGWAAACEPRSLVAYSALVGGAREDLASCLEYEYRHRRQSPQADPFAHHVVARAEGLPGVSEREAPGLLAALVEGPEALTVEVPERLRDTDRLNLTVINAGPERALPVRLIGFEHRGPCAVLTYQGDMARRVRHETTWTPARAGTWRLRLGYLYTDPQYLDETAKLEVVDELGGPPLIVTDGEPEEVTTATATARRSADFVETVAELNYPSAARAGQEVSLKLGELRFGTGAADSDFAEKVRLILTNQETGEVVEVEFPEAGLVERAEMDGLPGEYEFARRSVTTFELGR